MRGVDALDCQLGHLAVHAQLVPALDRDALEPHRRRVREDGTSEQAPSSESAWTVSEPLPFDSGSNEYVPLQRRTIDQRYSAGVASALPARSVARTRNTCLPRDRFVYIFGPAQAVHEWASMLHASVAVVSVAAKLNAALRELVIVAGPEVIVVSGLTVSVAAAAACGRRGRVGLAQHRPTP